MKYILLLLIVTTQFTNASAQLNKATWIVGGTGNFMSRNGTYTTPSVSYDSKYTDVTISPNIGYFLVDKLAVGLKSSLSWTKSKTFPPGGGSTDIKRFLAGPFARYYLLDIDKQFNILTEGNFQFGSYKAGDDKGSISSYSFMTGPVVYFNSSVGLEFLLGYTSNIEDVRDRYKNSLKGFQVSLGFQIHLEK